MTTATPYRIKSVDTALLALEQRPQFGALAPFPWNDIEERLKALFERSGLSLTHQEKGWLLEDAVKKELSDKHLCFAITLPPLSGVVYLTMHETDASRLMLSLLGGEESATSFVERDYSAGFVEYLLLEMMRELGRDPFFTGLGLRLEAQVDHHEIGKQPCYLVDVGAVLEGASFAASIFIPEPFREEWKGHISMHPTSFFASLSEESKEKFTVGLTWVVGDTMLAMSELKEVETGDFIILDRCLYDPEERKGSLILALSGKPLFRGRVKDGEVKLSDYPHYEEVEPMAREEFGSEYEDEEFSLDEEEGEGEPETEALGEDIEKYTTSTETGGGEESAGKLDVENLNVHLTVECGKIQLSMKELLSLAPGNLLPLNAPVEQGVDLVVGGKKIGKGELLKMGDVLGVRVVSL